MSDAGRMSQRLASSYREGDLRRAVDWRRRQPTTTAAPKSAAVSEDRSQTTVRSMLAAIGRLLPRLA
jgi:hypothetical protein